MWHFPLSPPSICGFHVNSNTRKTTSKLKRKTIIFLACRNCFIKQFITEGTERRQSQLVILDAGKWKGKWKAKNEGVGSLSLITHLILLLFHLQVDLGNLLNYEFLYTYRVHASVHRADCSSEACEQRQLLQKFSSPSVMSLSKRKEKKD